MLLRNSHRKFDTREDMVYFLGKLVRNWNMIMITVTVFGWLFMAYGIYFRMDQHITDDVIHITPPESVLLDNLEQHAIHNRLFSIELKLNAIEDTVTSLRTKLDEYEKQRSGLDAAIQPIITITPTKVAP